MELRVTAVLRAATEAEVVEALERNPGSARLRDQGWTPGFFELRLHDGEGQEVEHHHSVVWKAPDATPDALAAEELELGLEEVLRNLRDLEGLDVEREDVPGEAIDLRVEL